MTRAPDLARFNPVQPGTASMKLAATGLLVRFAPLSDTLPAWQVLLAQVVLCALTYLATRAVVDRALLRELRRLVGR